ncbi:unnamed protein product [Calypogeia fissa]
MAGEEADVTRVAEETLDPSSTAPALVQRPDEGPSGPAAGSFSKPIQAPRTPDSGVSREQVTPRLQVHLAAAESRVSNALQQVIKSLENTLLGALHQAARDIIDNIAKEAAEYMLLSQHKVAMLEHELNYNKEHALSLLMQVKRVSDAQISAAENKLLMERRRAQEAEAKLQTVQESNKKLKAELKRKGQQVEEFQRSIHPAIPQQGPQANVTEGPESRKGGNRLKSFAGQKIQQIADARNEAGGLAKPEVTTVDRSPHGVTEVQTENLTNRPLMHSLTDHDAYHGTRVEKGVLANGVSPQERGTVELTGTGHVTVNKLDNKQGSPSNQSASVAGVGNISAKVLRPHSSPDDSHPAVTQDEVSPSLMEKGQRPSSLKAELESRSAKDSDEEKSSLTIEALYCNDESLPPQVHAGDEYQSNKTHDHIELDTLDALAGLSSGGKTYAHEADISIHCTEELELYEDPQAASTFLPNTSSLSKTVKHDEKGASGQVFELPSGVADEVQNGLATREEIQGSEKAGQESNETVEDVPMVEADKPVLKKAEASPVTGNPNSDAPSENAQVVKSVSNQNGNNLPNEDARRPEAQTDSPDNLVTKRKRKQGATVSKYDLLVTERSSKRLEADGAVTGACSLLAAAGVDAHISSHDSRRLMQGARQLFSLAEGKWR